MCDRLRSRTRSRSVDAARQVCKQGRSEEGLGSAHSIRGVVFFVFPCCDCRPLIQRILNIPQGCRVRSSRTRTMLPVDDLLWD